MTFVKKLQTTQSVQEWSVLQRLLLLAALLGYAVFSHGQTTYTWRSTAASSNWNSPSNWSPAGVPTSSDHVVIVSSTNVPVFNGDSVNNFTLTSGTIDLDGKTLLINGNAVFTSGTVANGRVKAQGNAITFTNGTFDCKINSSTNNVAINGGTFNDSVVIIKNGTADQSMKGNATFNAPVSIRINSTGRLRFKGNMVFNEVLSLYNAGQDFFILEDSFANQYNHDIHLTIAGSAGADIRLGYGANVTYKGNIYVNSISGTGDIFLSEGASYSATLEAGKKIIVGSDGFNSGNLWIQRLTQTGSTPQTISLSGTASLRLGPTTTFNGKVIFEAPQVFLNGVTCNDSAFITKTGASNNTGNGGNTFNTFVSITNAAASTGYLRTNGGNTFNGTTIITNSCASEILLDYTTGSSYNGDVIVTKNATGSIRMAYAGINTFGGNIQLNNLNASSGILFCELAGSSATLAAGKTISIGSAGFAVGTLTLQRFTQIGSTTQTLNLGGGNLNLAGSNTFNGNLNINLSGTSIATIASGNNFNGKTSITAPQVMLNGSTFNDSVWITKTGAGTNVGSGGNTFHNFASIAIASTATGALRTNLGNTFNGTAVLSNASGQELLLEYTGGNVYNGDLYVFKTGSGNVRLAYSGTTDFNGNLIVSNTHATGGILFGESGTSVPRLAVGKTISIGTAGFSVGTLTFTRFIQNGSTSQTLALTGGNLTLGAGVVFNGNTNFSSTGSGMVTIQNGAQLLGKNNISFPQVMLNGGSFGDSTWITKTGATANIGAGGAIFNGFASITLASSATGMFRTNAGNTYNGNFVFTNASNQELSADFTSGGTYNGNVIINKSGVGNVRLAYSGANLFNGDITFNSSNTGGILFCESVGATATLANGKKFHVGTSGVTAGTITIQRFALSDTTTQNFTFTGNASLNFGTSNSFGGNVNVALAGTGLLTIGAGNTFNGKNNFTAPQVLLNGGTFGDSTWITKTGATNNSGTGGATFNSFASINLSSSATGIFRTSAGNNFNGTLVVNNHSTQDILFDLSSGSNYNGDVILTKTSSGNVRIAYNGSNYFNGNIWVNNTNATGGIYFCEAVTSSAILANGKSIAVGSSGFNAGLLSINRFNQLGSTPQTLLFTGNASLTFGSDNLFNGKITATLSGTGTLTVNANNTFNGKTEFTAPQLFLHGAMFADSTIINKTGNGSNNSNGGNRFSGFVSLSNSGGGNLVMGVVNADSFAQKTILTNTGGGVVYIAYQHSGQTTYFGDSLFISNTSTTATGYPGVRFCENNNTNVYFNGVVIATNAGTGTNNLIRFQNGSGETVFNRRTHFNNNCSGSTSVIRVSNNGSTYFHDNAYCSASGGVGVSFGNAGGRSIFASTCRILLGAGGYSAANFQINNVKQQGARGLVSITLSGTTLLTVSNSAFDEEINFTAPNVVFFNDTFNNVVRFTKTGATTNVSTGGNVFNDSVVITNSSSAALYLASTNPDVYNGDVTFVRSGSGAFDPAYNANVYFNKNIETAGALAITFGTGGLNGYVIVAGDSLQYINGVHSLKPTITSLIVNKNPAYPVVLHVPVNVAANGKLDLQSGIVKTDSLNLLTLLNNATANIGNDSAYVDGPLNYQMSAATTRTLVMPIGKDSIYRPVELTVSHNSATNYTYSAQLKNESAAKLNRTLSDSIDRVSDMRYWRIERLLTSTMTKSNANLQGNQVITLYYDSTDYVDDAANLRIVKNTTAQPNKWINIGGVGSANGKGFITSTSNPSAFNSFSDFTLGNFQGGGNPLPVKLTSLKAANVHQNILLEWTTAAEINNKGFEVQRSENGINFDKIGWVDGNGFSTENIHYSFEDKKVSPNVLYYYRLKQIDFDEQFEITKVVSAIVQVEQPSTIAWATISPNSSTGAKLMMNAIEEGTLDVKTYSSNGALVHSQTQRVAVGLNQLDLSFNHTLQAGTYISVITLNNYAKAIKWFGANE